MPHKADKSFFEKKKPWSEKKDAILAYYLTPYLPKVAKLNKPILLVDGFAGPGKFSDGNIGSPLIMCAKAIAIAKQREVNVVCVEASEELFIQLKANLRGFSFAIALHGTFADHLPAIAKLAANATVFLYVDPFAIEGLDWDGLESVFNYLKLNSSVEILLNFNATSFVRRALAALKQKISIDDLDIEDTEDIDAPSNESPSIDRLNAAVGGDWWRDCVNSQRSFREKVAAVADGLCKRLRVNFAEVGHTAIRDGVDQLPKYYLVFGTRHPDGLNLMNDAMVTTHTTAMFANGLFWDHALTDVILKHTSSLITRKHLIRAVIKEAFGTFKSTAIRGKVENLLKAKRLKSATGNTRINDDTEVVSSGQSEMF